jgi:hypothetical protein
MKMASIRCTAAKAIGEISADVLLRTFAVTGHRAFQPEQKAMFTSRGSHDPWRSIES